MRSAGERGLPASLGGRTNRTTMSSSSNTSIAKKARTKAEADFATWLMMAKLGGFDDLPLNARGFLTSYRTRLETMSEAESTALAVREVYSAYYSAMGGVGSAPEPKAHTNGRGQSRAVRETAQTSARSIGCTPFDEANDPKIPPGTADFREHGGTECRISISDTVTPPAEGAPRRPLLP